MTSLDDYLPASSEQYTQGNISEYALTNNSCTCDGEETFLTNGEPAKLAHDSSALQSDMQTIFNTLNLYVGVGLLSTGYAVRLGGWLSLLVLAWCTFMFTWTATLLSWSAQLLPRHIVPSYPNIAKLAMGKAGEWTVTLAILFEFWGALGMCLIVLWQSIVLLLPGASNQPLCWGGLLPFCLSARQIAIIGSALVVVPAVLIRSLSRLTSISISGVSGSFLLCSVMALAYSLDPDSSKVENPLAHSHKILSLQSIPVSTGIFLVSLSGHAGLPSLRRSMKHPENFTRCLRLTFAAMFLLYGSMGTLAYLYFGESLQVLVTASLTESSSVASIVIFHLGPVSLSLSSALSVLVALSVFSTIPTLVYVTAELIVDSAMKDFGGSSHSKHGFVEAVVRLLVLGVGYLTAIIGYDVLAHVESLVGGVCSILVSLILPAAIFYRLFKAEMNFWQRGLVKLLVAFGVCSTVGIFAKNIVELWSMAHSVP